MHSATKHSPFKVVYGFNPITPLDLAPILTSHRVCVDGKKKVKLIKQLHKGVKRHIEKRNAAYAKAANKGRKPIQFVPGDLVWIHLRKERFPNQRKSKLMPRVDGPFKVLEKVNDNAYKIDLPGEYNVSAIFNVRDLTLYLGNSEELDLRTNPIQQWEDDVICGDVEAAQGCVVPSVGPITRSMAKKLRTTLELLLRVNTAHSENLEAKALKPNVLTLLTCLED
ncbi:Transposon Ty3-I Gag-Pol polyprotein [Melia azedarach]|uniref:Transposon Ty3-I Gag-Pol polyprotein n=1 Tax=Melia azedarach TaxID=155640 RepID=A0ACC1X0T0_MELAZ|nr:Transposon Ty3-I Gag-Pol polyprotein [Melia azedarach]